jgi:hypothetical protein
LIDLNVAPLRLKAGAGMILLSSSSIADDLSTGFHPVVSISLPP